MKKINRKRENPGEKGGGGGGGGGGAGEGGTKKKEDLSGFQTQTVGSEL